MNRIQAGLSLLPLLLVFTPQPVLSQGPSNTEISDEEKCKFLNDSEEWQLTCGVILGVERAMDEATLATGSTADTTEDILQDTASWRNPNLFASLTDSEKSLPWAFIISAASVAIFEFTCETQKFEKNRTETDKLVGLLVSETARQKLMAEFNVDLKRRGYGNRLVMQNPAGDCDYNLFYKYKVAHQAEIQKMNELVIRSKLVG